MREKKLFSFTDSAVFKAKRFKNRVAIDAGFPSIPTIKKGRRRGGGVLIRRGHLLDILALGWALIQGNTVYHIT